jgi:hypothetical protein
MKSSPFENMEPFHTIFLNLWKDSEFKSEFESIEDGEHKVFSLGDDKFFIVIKEGELKATESLNGAEKDKLVRLLTIA